MSIGVSLQVERVLAQWKRAYDTAPIDDTPKLWVGYWADTYLESLSKPYVNNALFIMAAPFAFSPISALGVVVDRTTRVRVYVLESRSESGFRLTHWTVDRYVDDHGTVGFKTAVKTPGVSWIEAALCQVGQARLEEPPVYTFPEAHYTASLLAEQL